MSSNNALQKRLLRELQDLKNYKNIHKLELVYPFNDVTLYCIQLILHDIESESTHLASYNTSRDILERMKLRF